MDIQRIKNYILDLAIKGKLVSQDANDKPASTLLEESKQEQQQRIKKGKIKKEKDLPAITEDEIPFEIPSNWKWVRLGNIGQTNIGLTYSPMDIKQKGTPVLRSMNIKEGKMDYSDLILVDVEVNENKKVKMNDILICARNGSKSLVGKSALIDKEGMTFGAFMAIYRSEYNLYIHKVLNSLYFRSLLDGTNTTTINQVTQEMLKLMLIPLPPLEEQKRIVEKVEELFYILDKLEKEKADYDKHIDLLNNKILDLAIRGKLVKQDKNDETASILLGEDLSEITENEIDFGIPSSWKWVRLGDVISLHQGVQIDVNRQSSYKKIGMMHFLRIVDFTQNNDDIRYITPPLNSESIITEKDLVMVRYGTPGYVAKGREGVLANNLFKIKFNEMLFERDFLFYMFKSPFMQKQILAGISSTTMKAINFAMMKNVKLPLPPLEEQKRIVKKIEEIYIINRKIS